MAYTPSTAINNSRDFRNQYLRKSFSAWVKKLKARHHKRQELVKPIALRVAEPEPSVHQRTPTEQVQSEQSFVADNFECQVVRPRNAA